MVNRLKSAMARRYYIVPVLEEEGEFGSVRRLKLPPLPPGSATAQVIHDTLPWGLALVGTSDHSALTADPEIYALPDIALDNALDGPTKEALSTFLTARNIDAAAIETARLWRDALRVVGRALDSNFHEDAFFCAGG